jgi:Asp-tRNA(Asn)/Glu-tRNA(Gln) amidotransferase A subunit family amidase
VPRTGAMALSWTMDKLGAMARSVEDCALVLAAIHGPDGLDRSVKRIPFHWDATLHPSKLRIASVEERHPLEKSSSGLAVAEMQTASPDRS